MAVRVVVVDDHHVVRAGLVALLRQAPGLEVVGEAGNGQEALDVVEATKPDVVLMDMQMPVMNGVEATRQIRARFPDVEVLVLTTYDDDELIWGGIQAGAKGYLLKDAPPQQLLEGIETVARGQSLLSPEIAAKLVQVISQGGPARQEGAEGLTERETEILRLIASGAANKEIAAALFISENTVKTHISNLFQKLGARDRTEAVTKALARGWLRL
ncbi:MAG: response regulator transcription factor [Bacillota bacterium]|uniref:Stage 0 sporulation protein A homolog n=1 Tax=Symbiobacterium thermophilum TaxID=2734 RepID=A0A1Y2T6V2_SYMTR|nr:MAG: DNA-binding response regulator [Symbiobacterium thermophilum]PZN70898.1 MAG: DNA-binding response regulator [Bacillota bacterium]